MVTISRSKASFRGKTAASRRRQLANLRPFQKKPIPAVRKTKHETPKFSKERYRHNICRFAREQFFIPETQNTIVLEDWQKNKILRPLIDKGEEKYTLALVGMPKKNGKSTLAALVAEYYFFCGENDGEIYFAAGDKDQASWITFEKFVKAIRMNPQFYDFCRIKSDKVEHKRSRTIARVLPTDISAAGLNPSLVIFDELWSYRYEHMRRFYDEMTTVPTRKNPLTLIVTYAGWDTETLLYELYEAGLAGLDPKMFFYWSHENKASWVTEEYLETQKKRQRPSTYQRLHENRWTAGEEAFCTMEQYKDCVWTAALQGETRMVEDGIYVGVDIGLKHDCSAIAAVAPWTDGEIMLVDHYLFTPKGKYPLELEKTVEKGILALSDRFQIRGLYYDPFQFERSAQALREKGIRCTEFPQTVGNTVRMSETLSTLIVNKRLRLYPSKEVQTHLMNAKAKETDRGWRLVKTKKSEKIDLAVALAMACQGAVEGRREGSVGISGRAERSRDFETEEEIRRRLMESHDPDIWKKVA